MVDRGKDILTPFFSFLALLRTRCLFMSMSNKALQLIVLGVVAVVVFAALVYMLVLRPASTAENRVPLNEHS